MGQILFKDKIGLLTHSTGTISMAASTLSIGGQQYKTGILTVPVGTATANTRYQIYAVLDSGSVILVKSVNENSVGPATYNSWKLVGSFYAGATDTFGGFVTIEGVPQSDWTAFTPTGTWTTNSTYTGFYKRTGDTMNVKVQVECVGAPNAAGGLLFDVPLGLSIDATKLPSTDTGEYRHFGQTSIVNGGGAVRVGACRYATATTVRPGYYSTSTPVSNESVTETAPITVGSGDSVIAEFSIPIAEWAGSTSIKDL